MFSSAQQAVSVAHTSSLFGTVKFIFRHKVAAIGLLEVASCAEQHG